MKARAKRAGQGSLCGHKELLPRLKRMRHQATSSSDRTGSASPPSGHRWRRLRCRLWVKNGSRGL